MWPLSHSARSRTSRTWTPESARRQLRAGPGTSSRSILPRLALLLPPARHPAVQVAAERCVIPTDPASRAARMRVLVVAPDEHDLLVAVGDPRQLRAEPGVQRRDADRAGDVRLVELERGAHVHHQRARALLHARPGAESADAPRRLAVISGPRLMSTIVLEVAAAEAAGFAVARSTNRSSSSSGEQLVVPALVADRGGDLHVHARAAAEGAAEVAGPHLDAVGEATAAARAASGRCRARPPPCRPRGRARDVADEQRVAGQHRPRLRAARACRPARTRCARAGGPGCGCARTRTRPSSSSQPSSNGSWS